MKFRNIILFTVLSMALAACTFTLAEDVTPPPNYKSPTPPPTVGPLYPAAAPNLANGAAIYAEKCQPCHGDKGFGDGPQNAQLPVSVSPIGMADTVRAVPPADWYMIVTRGNIERFMPPFASLNEQQRWDVVGYVYNLSIEPTDMETGAALYTENCAKCHGENGEGAQAGPLTDQTYLAKTSNQDLYLMITTGNGGSMPGFKDTIAEADRWALASYVRSLSFDNGQVAAVAPTLTSTPEPATATATLEPTPTATTESTPEGTPAGNTPTSETPVTGTEVVTESPTAEVLPMETVTVEATPTSGEQAAKSGMVTGIIQNGSGGTVPDGLTVTLHGYDASTTSGNFTENYTEDFAVNPDGTYTFENVDLIVDRAYVVTTMISGTEYNSDPVFIDDTMLQSEENPVPLDMPITFYEGSTDTSTLSVDRLHIFLDFSTPGSVQVVEVYILSNPTTNAIVPSSPTTPTVLFDLPEGAVNLQFETGDIGDPYILTENGFGDLTPVLPGSGEHQVVVGFSLPYDKSLDFTQTMVYPTGSVIVMSPEGTVVTSSTLSEAGTREYQNIPYMLYNGSPLAANDNFEMNVSGKPASATSTSSGNSNQSLLIGAGVLGVVLILMGVYLFWRDRQKEEDYEDDEEPAIESSEDAMDAIIALDDQFRAGAISEEIYRQRRAELKARLKDLL